MKEIMIVYDFEFLIAEKWRQENPWRLLISGLVTEMIKYFNATYCEIMFGFALCHDGISWNTSFDLSN